MFVEERNPTQITVYFLVNGVVSKDGLRAYIEIGAIENDDKNLNSTMYHAFLVLRK